MFSLSNQQHTKHKSMFKVSFIKLASIIKQLMASVKQTFPSTVFHLPLELVSIWQAACVYTQEVKKSSLCVGTNVSASTDTPASDQGGYVKGLVTYMVTDDLSVSPMSMMSVVGLLNKIDIKDFSVLEEGINEVMTFQLCILLFVFN